MLINHRKLNIRPIVFGINKLVFIDNIPKRLSKYKTRGVFLSGCILGKNSSRNLDIFYSDDYYWYTY